MLFIFSFTANMFATGSNSYGKLGLNLNPSDNLSVSDFQVLPNFTTQNIQRMSLGSNFAFAVTSSGLLYSWGDNDQGQAGLSQDVVQSNKPELVTFFSNQGIKLQSAAGGQNHALILGQNGSVWSMGDNISGQLGRILNGTTQRIGLINTSSFQKGETVKKVATSYDTSLVLTNLGNIYVFGACYYGLCGPAFNLSDFVSTPTLVQLKSNVTKFWVTEHTMYFEDVNGTFFGLGDNQYGELCVPGNGSNTKPIQINAQNVDHVHGGLYHTVFMRNGTVLGCGKGTYGQFGTNISFANLMMISTTDMGTVISTSATSYGTYIIASNGVYSSGKDEMGELSQGGGNISHYGFTKIESEESFENVTAVSAHFNFAFMYAVEEIQPGLSGWVIFGIVAAAVVVVVGASILIWWLVRRQNGQPRYHYITEEKNKLVFNDDQW